MENKEMNDLVSEVNKLLEGESHNVQDAMDALVKKYSEYCGYVETLKKQCDQIDNEFEDMIKINRNLLEVMANIKKIIVEKNTDWKNLDDKHITFDMSGISEQLKKLNLAEFEKDGN